MQKINLSRENIDHILTNNKVSKDKRRGSFGLCATYENDTALKFDLSFLKNGEELVCDLSSVKSSISVPQIEKLSSLQSKIKLSSLPLGVAYCEGVPVAVMIKYFNDHNTLDFLSFESFDNLMSVLYQINDIVDELCQNYIYQKDVWYGNFLYSKHDYVAQAIDFDGEFVEILSRKSVGCEGDIYCYMLSMFRRLIVGKLNFALHNQREISKLSDILYLCKFNGCGYKAIDSFLKTVDKKVLRKVR